MLPHYFVLVSSIVLIIHSMIRHFAPVPVKDATTCRPFTILCMAFGMTGHYEIYFKRNLL
jgi:hypothetical protein